MAELLRIACYAPSARNRQPWHWIVIQDPFKTQEIAEMVIQWMEADLAVNPDPQIREDRKLLIKAWQRGEDRICRGAPHLILAHGETSHKYGYQDTALALGYLELYAPLIGLGACWAGYVQSAVEAYRPLADRLNLPAGHQIWGVMMVGYPKFSYYRAPPRRGPVVSWD
jgi:nitroreductase